jgi:adenine-specific DNA-methyltransferase
MATRTTKPKAPKPAKPINPAKSYDFPGEDEKALMRPDIGTQAQFKKKKEPRKYRYDSSLSPSLDWDGQNPAREQGEALIKEILDAQSIEQAKAAADKLRRISKPFLNWAGKAERLSFDVPTLPLFVHERLSTKAILETLKGHKRDKQLDMFDLFGDPGHSITGQVLKAPYPPQSRHARTLRLSGLCYGRIAGRVGFSFCRVRAGHPRRHSAARQLYRQLD